ncbi:MAG: ABC transporter ATP-binding protein [Lachnospiraceae bacterium]|nr:ABC transporter ATP-binding protein [Lachnospiraceae bacterium]
MSQIEIKNLCKYYGQDHTIVKAVDDISMNIEQGEFVVILGPSGSGKSTFVKMIGGLDLADSGEIVVNGENILQYSPDRLAQYRSETIGFVFQSFQLLPNLTVKENIEMPVYIDEKIPDESYVKELLEQLELYEMQDRLPAQLSGGQQQRVAIARALINKPDIILADEPTGNLDGSTSERVVALLMNMCKKYGSTLIFITHNEEISKKADRVIRITDGMINER